MKNLNAATLTSLAYGINGVGGGGNLLELYNPAGEKGIVGLVQELRNETFPLVTPDKLSPSATVCCLARLGKPGAKADQYAVEGTQALVKGLQELCSNLNMPFPSAIFPVEATAGQMARALRAARAASSALQTNLAILDGDVCGGMAVPAVPLAFNIYKSLAQFPDVALIELLEKEAAIIPKITLITEKNPEELEKELRKKAGSTPLGAVWFAWLLSKAADFERFFTIGSVSNSIARGEIVRGAIENGDDPAEALLRAGEIKQIVARGKVIEVEAENVPGFAQFSYTIKTNTGQKITMAARNEYIVVYSKDDEVLAKAPKVINVLGKNGPIQSHVLKPGDKIAIVVAQPQCLIDKPGAESHWEKIWKIYWDGEKAKGTWNHLY